MGPPVTSSSGFPVADNVWHSLALTWRSTTAMANFYIDGVGSVALTGVFGTIEPYLGKLTVGSPELAGGVVDELYLYDTAP